MKKRLLGFIVFSLLLVLFTSLLKQLSNFFTVVSNNEEKYTNSEVKKNTNSNILKKKINNPFADEVFKTVIMWVDA